LSSVGCGHQVCSSELGLVFFFFFFYGNDIFISKSKVTRIVFV